MSGSGLLCGPSEVLDPTGESCMPDPNAHMVPDISWQDFKKMNPLATDRTDQEGVPDELKDLFTEDELRSKNRIPKELRGLFSDEELGGWKDLSSLKGDLAGPAGGREGPSEALRRGVELKKGMQDSSTDGLVSRVQALLEKHGYLATVDGVFGDDTERAVLEFQRNNKENGLVESGVVDSKTLAVLESAAAKRRQEEALSGEFVLSEKDAERQRARGRNAPTVSGSGRVSASKLYQDLMAGIVYPKLCKAMVANAIAESGLRYNANGDCGSYAKSKGKKSLDTSLYPNSFHSPKRGKCCSFGLWQYNICGGLGNRLLGSALNGSDEEKIAILISYDKQVQFMISHVNKKIDKIKSKESKSVDFWVDWFVRKVERPAKMDRAVAKRRQIARGLNLA